MKRIFILYLIGISAFAVFATEIKTTSSDIPLTCSFTRSPPSGPAPLWVQYNVSTNGGFVQMDLGNGDFGSFNPDWYQYTGAGTFAMQAMCEDANGGFRFSAVKYVEVGGPPPPPGVQCTNTVDDIDTEDTIADPDDSGCNPFDLANDNDEYNDTTYYPNNHVYSNARIQYTITGPAGVKTVMPAEWTDTGDPNPAYRYYYVHTGSSNPVIFGQGRYSLIGINTGGAPYTLDPPGAMQYEQNADGNMDQYYWQFDVGVGVPAVDIQCSTSGIGGPYSTSNCSNGTTHLSWTATNATSCTASAVSATANWTGPKALSSTGTTVENLGIGASRTYTLTCSNGTGSSADSITVTGVDQAPIGNNDGYYTGTIQGWSFDPDTPTVSNQVHLYFNGVGGSCVAPACTIIADVTDVLRSDVNTAYGITGNHGFVTPIPAQYCNGLTYPVTVYGINTNPGGVNPSHGVRNFSCGITTPTSIAISPTPVRADGTTTHNIVFTTTDTAGGSNVTHQYVLINYQGSNGGSYRGYLSMYYDPAYTGWNAAPFRDKRTCAGTGVAAIQPGYGDTFIAGLNSCSVVTSGNTRTTTFTVRFSPTFTTPATNNDISGFTCGSSTPGCVGATWTNFDINFPLLNLPPTATNVKATEPDYCTAGASITVNWTFNDPEALPQTAYRVQVNDNPAFQGPAEYDTGKIVQTCANGATCATYISSNLQWNTNYRVRAMVWDSVDNASPWAEQSLCQGPPGNPSGCYGNQQQWRTPAHPYPGGLSTFTWTPAKPVIDGPVQFDDGSTQCYVGVGVPGPCTYSWNFGDGGTSTQQNPLYTYRTNGNFSASLRATDGDGYSCSAAKNINIQKPIPSWREVLPR